MSKLKDLIKTTRKANPEGSTLRQAISQARQGESVNVVPREINPVMEVPRFEPVEPESAGGLTDVPQSWMDTITPVTPSSRSASRWSGTTPSSRGGNFGETESQGEGYFTQSRQSPLERANNWMQGFTTSAAGGMGNFVGGLLDTVTGRYNSDAADQWLDLVQDSMENRDDESYFERPEVQSRLEKIRDTRNQSIPFVQDIYERSDEAIRKGEEQYAISKVGVDPALSTIMDVGRIGGEMLMDAAFGAVTGGSGTLPMVARSFGGGMYQARAEGADRREAILSGAAQGAVDYATERMFGVALPFARLYGGGSLDDVVQRGIQSAVSRFASTEAGQRALGGGLTVAASALTEGAEEFIADWASWQLPNIIYGGDVASVEETLSNSLYDFMLGSVMGGLGGAVSPSTYNYRLPTGQESAGGVVNSDTTTGMEAPESPGSVQNTAQNDSIPEATRRAVDLLVSGQEITGGQAERIARRPEAVALLGQLTGTEINTDAPLSRVKADIRAVAGTRAASGSVSGQGQVNTQAGQRTTDTSHQAERTAAQRVHDANRVRGAAASTGMGESGQRAISAAYDGSVDADRYYAGFTAYYEAGLSGRAQEQVRSDYAADLTEAQKFAAYTAGQNDAAASLQREQAGVNYATVYGDEAGFVPSEHSASLSQETTRFYNVLAKATGTKITVTAATGEGGANGWYRDGTIYISSDAQNAGEVVAMHEITHRLQEIAPEAYRKYRDYAVNALSELEGNSSALVERYKTLYSNSGINLTTEEAMDEAAANFAGELIRDPERFERLAREDRGVARRLLDAVKDLIRKIRRAIHGPSAEDVAVMNELGLDLDTLEQAARLWEDALRAGRETTLQAGARDGRMGTTRNSLKEDRDHGRTREETRGAFLRRAAGAGYAVYEGETAGAYGYRRVDRESARENAGQIQAEISNLGIEADIISGPILINRNGKTIERPVSHAVTIDRARILVNENSTLPPRNVAGHEAFHLWKSGIGRDAYIETVEDNLDFTSDDFRNYQSAVSYTLFGEEADLSDEGQMARLREELLAYISGDIHEGTNEAMLRPMFRDFDAVRAAWEQLVEENSGKVRFSLKSTDSDGRELSAEQRAFFRDSKVVDEDGQLLVVYHGTDADFTVFDRSRVRANMDIQGSFFSPWELDAQGYGGNVTAYYLNITNPADEATAYRALRRYQGQNEAGAKAREYLEKLGYDGVNNSGEEYIAFYPEQIKRVDNFSPTDDPDIRRSIRGGSDILRENAALQEENASLRERVEYWRGQTRRTTPGQVDKKAVDRAARELIRDFDSTLNAADISGDLLSLYNYMGTGREGNDELTYTEARRRADEIARRVVESAQVTEDGAYQEYRALREYLRTSPLSISQEDAADIPDYSDFRRRNFGRLNLRGGDTNIDQVYQELSEMWPEFFDETRENNPVDQLLHISEVAEQLYRTTTGNPFAGNLREAQAGVSNEILERFFDIPQVRATFADRAAQAVENERQRGRERVNRVREQRDARITQLREQNRERVQRAIQRERDTRERQLERMKNRYQARDAAGRERRTARELRARISRHVKDLSRKLLRPSDKQHIPEQLRTAVAAMLDAINLESVYTVDPETGKRRKGGEGDPTKRTEAFRALREQYEAILNRPDDYSYTGVLDPNLMDNLAEVIRMRDTPLFEMSLDQLTTVWQTVKGVEASITSANKLLGESRYAGVAELAYGIRESSRGKRQKNNYGGSGLGRITGFGDQLLNTDMMNSLTFLHLFGDGGDALYHELQAARDQKTRIMQETVRLAKQVVGKTNVDKLQKKIHTFQVEGGELKLSTAQLMSLYELNQRQQAQDHIYKGGIRPGPRSSFVSRDKSPGENVAAVLGRMDAPSSVVRVTQADVVNMLSELSEEEIRIADGLQSIMQGYLADEGNRESMKVYGYEKFTEDHYFPISSDPNQVQSKIGDILEGGERRPVSVSEWGSAKSTVTGANNGLLLGDIFDVFAQHAVDMSTYASHLGALEDVNRVRNFAFRNAEGHRSGTIKEIIQRVAGKGGNAYLDKLLQDISRGTARGGVAGLSRLTANYKAASVGLNLRVALQQPTSYARALAVMSPKYLADPRVLKSGGWKKALKYAPIAQWKDWGNFEINQGRQFQNILFDTDGTMDRLRNRAMTLASVMDSATWGRLWNACELEILDTRPSLQEGSEEFYSAVAQRFTDVVDQTQVVDNVLGRSQFMRSGDNLAKMAASYMGEPTQTYNMLYRAYRDTVQEQDPKKRSQAIKRLGRTAAAVTFSAFMTAVAAALWDGVRDDEDRDEKYWERVLKHIGPNFAQNVNPVGMLPYARDILSIVQGYDVSRMDLEAVTSLFSALQNMQKAVNGEGRYTIRGAALNLAAELSRITGLPLATVKRDAEAIARAVGVETEDWYFQYQVERALNSVFYSGNRGEFYDIAFGALADGDLDVYEQITQDLMSQGVKGSTIESAMRSRLKAAQESDPNFSMSQAGQDLIGGRPQYHVEAEEKGSFSADDLSPEARTSYNEQRAGDYREWVDALEENGGFGKLDDEGKDKLLSAADQLASDIALRDHSQGAFTETDMDQWERWASKGAEYGVDPSEALLFKTAYDMAESEKDEDGDPISGSKKENALELAADLMPWLTDRELEYLMSNYWAPEDRALKELKEGKFLR